MRLMATLVVISVAISFAETGRAGTRGFNLSWNGCATNFASLQRCYACDGQAGVSFVFQGSFRPVHSIPDFAGTSSIVDITSESATLPDFWKIATGDCAAAAFSARNPVVGGGCATPSLFASGNVGGGYSVEYRSPGRVRLRVDWAVASPAPPPLVAGQLYPAFAIMMDADAAVMAGCQGCATGALIELNSIEVFGFGVTEDELINVSDVRNFVVWQEYPFYSPCTVTSTRSTSWGAIKSMYR